jgi:hypothetical protein
LYRNTKERLRAFKADSTLHIPVGSGGAFGYNFIKGRL